MISNKIFTTTECHLTTGATHRHSTFQIRFGSKEEVQTNAITKMFHNQICTSLFKYLPIQEIPVVFARKI